METPSLHRLAVFVLLAECRSFKDCARRLRRTQPTVSRQINELEAEMKQTLFTRDPHRVDLTAEGRLLLARVGEPIREILRAFESGDAETRGLAGPLRFGTLAEVGQSRLFERVLEFCRLHPQVVPDVRYLEEIEIRRLLRAGEIDFGIVSHPLESETLRSHPLIDERIVLIGRPDLKLPAGPDARIPMVGYRNEDPLIELFEKKFARKKSPKHRLILTVNSHRSMIDALQKLDGFAYLPAASARKQLAAGTLREIPGFEHRQSLYLGYVVHSHENVLRKAFRKFLLSSGERSKDRP